MVFIGGMMVDLYAYMAGDIYAVGIYTDINFNIMLWIHNNNKIKSRIR